MIECNEIDLQDFCRLETKKKKKSCDPSIIIIIIIFMCVGS